MTTATTNTMTDQQATDEAMLLLTRKMMRLHPDAYADVIRRLPDGARHAINLAENRADALRNQHAGGMAYPVEVEDDETED